MQNPSFRHHMWLVLVGSGVAASAAHPQALSLTQALDRAGRGAYDIRAARANVKTQGAPAIASLRGILPTLRFDGGLIRTTDPIGAFGNTLRQRTIAQADFEPGRLNYPPVSENWTGAMVIEQPLFNADAIAGRAAASRAARASSRVAEWTATGTRVEVIRAYYGTMLATAKVSTLEAAARAAQAHVHQAEQMVKNGLATTSDALLASVKSGEVDGQLIEARGDVMTAKLALATVMGTPSDTAFMLAASLPPTTAIRELGESTLSAGALTRADVAAARDLSDAAEADAWRARSLYLPRLNSFARYDWNSSARMFAGDKNWTVGVIASWSPFTGASEIAEQRAVAGRRESAAAMREGADARAQLDVQQSAVRLQTALARLAIAESAVGQSGDAHRIVARKYEGGLTGVAELLDAAALETQSRLGLDGARYAVLMATAERLKALGRDPGTLAQLDRAQAVAGGVVPQ